MTSRTPLIAGNWKMNGTLDEAQEWTRSALLAASDSPNDVAIFPPHPFLIEVAHCLPDPWGPPVALGGQACHGAERGAFTGAVSASMLASCGCRYVLCGHSERRTLFGEDDEAVAASLAQALEVGLEPVLCVGESLAERQAGRTQEVLLRQVDAGLERLRGPADPIVIAYEPVWAIGTGEAASAAEAAEAHGWIRARVATIDTVRAERVRILYGGSVNPDNIGGFLEVPDIDGALIGGASLDPVAFARLVQATP